MQPVCTNLYNMVLYTQTEYTSLFHTIVHTTLLTVFNYSIISLDHIHYSGHNNSEYYYIPLGPAAVSHAYPRGFTTALEGIM